MPVGMSGHGMLIGRRRNALPLALVLELGDGCADVGEISVYGDVELVRREQIIVTPGRHDLAGLGADGVKVTRRQRLGICRTARRLLEEARVEILEVEAFVLEAGKLNGAAAQREAKRRFHG